MDSNKVLDYILKRYNINQKKLSSSKSTISEIEYSGTVIMELKKILKHFKINI
jgi:hypothetical protein